MVFLPLNGSKRSSSELLSKFLTWRFFVFLAVHRLKRFSLESHIRSTFLLKGGYRCHWKTIRWFLLAIETLIARISLEHHLLTLIPVRQVIVSFVWARLFVLCLISLSIASLGRNSTVCNRLVFHQFSRRLTKTTLM